jgi:EmrB/QacA subfamily drug resistance transporter
MGVVGLVISFAPAIGPTLSGWIIDRLPWNFLFFLTFPVAAIALIIGIFVLNEKSETEKSKIDISSVILSSLGFGGIMYGINSTSSGSLLNIPQILSFLVGIVCLFLFIRRQLKLTRPMLEFRVFQNRTFTLTTIISMISFGMMVGVEVLMPLYIQNIRGLSAFISGLILLPGALLTALMSPVSGSLYDRFGARPLLIIGDTIMAVMSIYFIFIGVNTSIAWIVIVYALRMIGISVITTPAMTAGVNALSDDLIVHATSVYNTFRQIGGSLGTVLLVAVMTTGTNQNLKVMAPKAAQIRGLQIAFLAATVLSFAGLIFSLGIKSRKNTWLDSNA